MIEIKNISKTYNKTFVAVDDISMEISSGSIVGFIGPNGAGKTTTLNMITGILEQDSGTIKINGFDTLENPTEAKKEFGFVSDSPNSFLSLKGIEYLNFIADVYGIDKETRNKRIKHYSKELALEDALGDKISSYSHGMRQKIMVIGTLIHDPNVLILDEPLTGLDPQSSFVLKEIMKDRAKDGKAVLFSTHVLEVAEKLCDQIVIISHGHILFTGTLHDLKSKYEDLSLEEIFLEVTKK
ncbi:MAG: ABC transporter ATP-binding protein [Erysipelothrix sp.]|nr:ABC transporter ATP-binding protein [Erysipelothrix sp.]